MSQTYIRLVFECNSLMLRNRAFERHSAFLKLHYTWSMPLTSIFLSYIVFVLLSFVILVILSFRVHRGKDSNLLAENCFISQVPFFVIYIDS